MSYDLDLVCPHCKRPYLLEEAHHEGGTQPLYGQHETSMNITYNYSRVYSPHDFSIKDLEGKTGAETVAMLERMLGVLDESKTDPDYWKPTEGNARKPLTFLLEWAKAHPEGVWELC